MKGGGSEEIPVNLELLSSDDRVGVVLVVGSLLFGIGLGDLLGFGSFFHPDGIGAHLVRPVMLVVGGILVFLSAQRLLIPGCRPLVRINFGGITDVRLVTAPVRWQCVEEARRPDGVWRWLLPGVILEMSEEHYSPGMETRWSRLIHLPARLLGRQVLFLECGTLDQSVDEVLAAIQSHLRARQAGSRR